MVETLTEDRRLVKHLRTRCPAFEKPSRLGEFLLRVTGAKGRYQTSDTMTVPIKEFSRAEYPEDPADYSVHHGKYSGRFLVLKKNDYNHFDFVFEPERTHIAKVIFRDIDVALMTPGLPMWTRDDDGLRRIALTDRQWNRQQVSFTAASGHIEVLGGDGFEIDNLFSAELAKNCLNAGLWEVLLYTMEHGRKALYYQGWFRFPLGHYRAIFEHNTCLSYSKHFHYLEHWINPEGTPVPIERLRRVISEREASTEVHSNESVIAAGE